MARVRPATEPLERLSRKSISDALDASLKTGSNAAFYKLVGMRNPSRSYYVRYMGRLHSLKAVVAYALRQSEQSALARDFHALDAAKLLRQLSFSVEHVDGEADERREREWIERLRRPGQQRFRIKLIDFYGHCVFSGCSTSFALEAAHVDHVKAKGSDSIGNGILLRADLHKLFDANQIAISPIDGSVHVSSRCMIDYGTLLKDKFFVVRSDGPTLEDFASRWDEFSKDGVRARV